MRQEGVTSYVDFPDKSQQSLTLFQLFDQCFMGKSSYRELRLKGIVIQLLSYLLEVGTDQPAKIKRAPPRKTGKNGFILYS